MKCKVWIISFVSIILVLLTVIAGLTIYMDPYLHYHKPLTDRYDYVLDNQRSMNNGIIRFFDYDAVITGSSMTENFSTSELDALFGTNSIKISFPGATYKELSDNISLCLRQKPDLKMVLLCLDLNMLSTASDAMRTDMGSFPTYLYDDNIFNDVEYLFNRDVLVKYIYRMTEKRLAGVPAGITSFDDYSYWDYDAVYGLGVVNPGDSFSLSLVGPVTQLSEQERSSTLENIQVNISSLARQNPHVEFYCYFSPYSVAWWQTHVADGTVYKYLDALQIATEELLSCENINLFSFFQLSDIVDDLNNYKDTIHYGSWVNSLILNLMSENRCRLTSENYTSHLDYLKNHYLNYDYVSLLEQEDYSDDALAARIAEEKYGFVSSYPRS